MSAFTLLPELGLVVFALESGLDDEGLLGALVSAYDHPDFVPGWDELTVLRDAGPVRVTPAGLARIAATLPRRRDPPPPVNRVAVVAVSDVAYGLARLYGARADRPGGGPRVSVHRALAPACAWLDDWAGRSPGTTLAAVSPHLVRGQDPSGGTGPAGA